jgi:hypothetical protein
VQVQLVSTHTMASNRSTTSLAQNFLRAFLQRLGCRSSTSSRRTNLNDPSTKSRPSVSLEGETEASHTYKSKTMVVDVEGCLLRSCSTFPYFMVVALEAGGGGGGLLRGLLLLLSYPFICLLGHEMGLSLMVMLTVCGLREEALIRVGKAVLPKHLLEDVGLPAFEMLKKMDHGQGRVICASRMPRVMVEAFLREYLEVEHVLGRELKMIGGVCTGFMQGDGGEGLEDGSHEFISATASVGVSSSTCVSSQLPLFSHCKVLSSYIYLYWFFFLFPTDPQSML